MKSQAPGLCSSPPAAAESRDLRTTHQHWRYARSYSIRQQNHSASVYPGDDGGELYVPQVDLGNAPTYEAPAPPTASAPPPAGGRGRGRGMARGLPVVEVPLGRGHGRGAARGAPVPGRGRGIPVAAGRASPLGFGAVAGQKIRWKEALLGHTPVKLTWEEFFAGAHLKDRAEIRRKPC
ncbi:hypothetical protein DIPPA_13059 [Diplonema papillatum]|nr:hypothetical protein DIPPA_13059 [Diplonema papillatum]